MKKIIQYMIVVLMSSVILHASCYDKYKCQPKSEIDTETKQRIYSLKNCRLPNMDTFTINAPNVLNSDGTPKKYFETKNTVCDVLGWFNYEIPYIKSHYPTLSNTVTQALTLDLSHLESKTEGGATTISQIHLDTDIDDNIKILVTSYV